MSRRMMKHIAAMGLALGAGSAVASDAIVAMEYSNPDVDIAYQQVHIRDIDNRHAKIVPAPWLNKETFHWKAKEGNYAFLNDQYHKAVSKALTKGSKYKVVDAEKAGVLVIDTTIVSFTPYAEQSDKEAVTKGSGSLTFLIQVRDGGTGELIYIAEASQEVGTEYQPNTEMARVNSAKDLFAAWGAIFRTGLDGANK